MTKPNLKIKLVIVLAIALLALLLFVAGYQIVKINQYKNTVNAQQTEITRLQNQKSYYQNQSSTSSGSKITGE